MNDEQIIHTQESNSICRVLRDIMGTPVSEYIKNAHDFLIRMPTLNKGGQTVAPKIMCKPYCTFRRITFTLAAQAHPVCTVHYAHLTTSQECVCRCSRLRLQVLFVPADLCVEKYMCSAQLSTCGSSHWAYLDPFLSLTLLTSTCRSSHIDS